MQHTNILGAPIVNLFWPPAAKTAPDWLQLCRMAPNMRAETKNQRNSYSGAPETGRELQQAAGIMTKVYDSGLGLSHDHSGPNWHQYVPVTGPSWSGYCCATDINKPSLLIS